MVWRSAVGVVWAAITIAACGGQVDDGGVDRHYDYANRNDGGGQPPTSLPAYPAPTTAPAPPPTSVPPSPLPPPPPVPPPPLPPSPPPPVPPPPLPSPSCVRLYSPKADPSGGQKPLGARCHNASQCTTYFCGGGVCVDPNAVNVAPLCLSYDAFCTYDGQCDSNQCRNGNCGSAGCSIGSGAPCADSNDCCTLICRNGVCAEH